MTVPENNRAPCIGGPADGQFIAVTDEQIVRVGTNAQRVMNLRLDAPNSPSGYTVSTYLRETLRMNDGPVVREYALYVHEDTSPHAALMLLLSGYATERKTK